MPVDQKVKFEEWKRYADEDQEMAEIAMKENGPPNQICFHAQQMAEKYLKGILIYANKEFQKKHQLDYLLHLCEAIDSSFAELTNDIKYLTEFYIETRYPGDIPEFSLKEAEQALASALRIKEFVLRKIR